MVKEWFYSILLITVLLAPLGVLSLFPDYNQCKSCEQKWNSNQKEPAESNVLPVSVLCFMESLDTHAGIVASWATLVIAGFTATLWFTSGNQAREMKRSVDVLVRSEQAWLAGGGPLGTDDKVHMSIENFGRTACVVTKIRWGLCPRDIFRPHEKRKVSEFIDEPWIKRFVRSPITVGSIGDVYPSGLRRPIEEASFEASKHIEEVFFGKIDYKDIFKQSRFTTFKLILQANGSRTIEGSYDDWE